MPKMRSNRAAKKRFRLTGSGRVRRYKAYASHILTKKTTKRKRKLRQSGVIAAADQRRVKRMISA
jgi:large subunit ribosomal protein L35